MSGRPCGQHDPHHREGTPLRSLLNSRTRSTDDDSPVDRACAELLAGLDFAQPLSLDMCIDAVSRSRGRDISVYEVDLTVTEVFGALMTMPDRDVIVFDRSASPAHRCHIVEHELGHLVLGHHGRRDSTANDIDTPASVESPQETMLCRSDFHSPEELDAERFARLLRSAIHASRRAANTAVHGSGPAQRVAKTLYRHHN